MIFVTVLTADNHFIAVPANIAPSIATWAPAIWETKLTARDVLSNVPRAFVNN